MGNINDNRADYPDDLVIKGLFCPPILLLICFDFVMRRTYGKRKKFLDNLAIIGFFSYLILLPLILCFASQLFEPYSQEIDQAYQKTLKIAVNILDREAKEVLPNLTPCNMSSDSPTLPSPYIVWSDSLRLTDALNTAILNTKNEFCSKLAEWQRVTHNSNSL